MSEKKIRAEGFTRKKNSYTSSEQKQKFVQAENSPPPSPSPHHFSNGPSLRWQNLFLVIVGKCYSYIVFLHFIHIHFIRPCYRVFIHVCICAHLTNFLKTNLRKLVVNCISERPSKGRFLKPDKLQNHSNEGKGKERKKERREGKEEKRKKKQWLRC